MYIYIYMCVCVCMCPRLQSLTLLYMYIYIYIYMCVCVCVCVCACVYVCMCVCAYPFTRVECDAKSFLYVKCNGFGVSFPSPKLVALPRLKITAWPTYLPLAGGKIVWWIPFTRLLSEKDMSRIWTRAAASIPNSDNYYTMSAIYISQEIDYLLSSDILLIVLTYLADDFQWVRFL